MEDMEGFLTRFHLLLPLPHPLRRCPGMLQEELRDKGGESQEERPRPPEPEPGEREVREHTNQLDVQLYDTRSNEVEGIQGADPLIVFLGAGSPKSPDHGDNLPPSPPSPPRRLPSPQ